MNMQILSLVAIPDVLHWVCGIDCYKASYDIPSRAFMILPGIGKAISVAFQNTIFSEM